MNPDPDKLTGQARRKRLTVDDKMKSPAAKRRAL